MPPFEELHQKACDKGLDTYTDPLTGNQVFTRLAHIARGACCGNLCRHCPYQHMNVKKSDGSMKRR